MSTPALSLDRITCTFASRERQAERYTAVRDTTLSVAAGEFVSVVGPTGCGKSIVYSPIGRVAGPAESTITRSDSAIASSRSCVIKSTDLRLA
ncbi:MAG TPA: ATP-binding cassette domain-containing protein, partial [Casimicrobiaceae bacterium]|nr:ATP-binding cassette domain-containing protein [Casimicrobiaceae bacterium]